MSVLMPTASHACPDSIDMCAADFYMSLYNVVFTAVPPLIMGLLDEDVDKTMSSRYAGALLAFLDSSHLTDLANSKIASPQLSC